MIQLNRTDAPEPIAIIGLGCRFPGGANDWRSFWKILKDGTDAITETPSERWNLQKFYASGAAQPGKTQSKWGGYVSGIDAFDPQLFGISPREAASMDPQQRMLLEVAFRALEDAGQPLESVAGKPVSVFVGISSFDYAVASLSFRDRGVINAYCNTGSSSSIAANRISYCFDLRGPSVAVDTACSSSLVAVHLACESLWRGEATMALAGGVNALLLPDFYVAFSQLGVLAADGRCKSFDSRANGYVRSEGAGMALLKPLSAALRDRDSIYAVIRSTALNQDGRTPGMTVPSQTAQEALVRAACDKANVRPSEIQYVEAHGTGTAVGDPIEASALGAVLGEGRSARQPCWIGSVKTNIGHLEAGAGIASLIKVALALHYRCIPRHLHFQQANPAIDFEQLRLKIPLQTSDWNSDHSRLAGINGFGYGGANAHVLLEQAPEGATGAMHYQSQMHYQGQMHYQSQPPSKFGTAPAHVEEGNAEHFSAPVLLPLSARSRPALLARVNQLADWLETGGADHHLAEVAGYLAHRRSHYAIRATVTAASFPEMIAELRGLAANALTESPTESMEDFSANKLARGAAFVCCGQGPQWWAMGRGLLKYSPTFRKAIKRCDAEFLKYGDWSLMRELTRDEAESRMQKTSIAQPSIFAIQIALAAVWESWGVRPTALVGHSVGEIAAAFLAGALSWEDAACVAFHRGRTMDLASSQGAMLAAGLAAEEVPSWLEGIEADASLAAVNGPSSVTISGARPAIEELASRLQRAGVFCRRLTVEYAFHSPQMDPVRAELLGALEHIQPREAHTPLISTVTGKLIDGRQVDADYWWRNVRQSVRFSDAMACLSDMGYGLAIEVGPHPVLAYSIDECFQDMGRSIRTLPSLNRQQADLPCITKSLGNLYTLGFDVQWSGFYNKPTRRIDLPAYPFQTQHCWSESNESRASREASVVHPLLGELMVSPTPQWQQRIDLKLHSYLSDHAVRNIVVYPAAAMLETALAAVRAELSLEGVRLDRIRLHTPCVLSEDRPQWIQTSIDVQRRQVTLAFREADEQAWSPLATIEYSGEAPDEHYSNSATAESSLAAARERCTEEFDGSRLYAYCRELGLKYGPAFQGIGRGLRRDGESVAEVNLPRNATLTDHQSGTYSLHPTLLDSCFHGMIAADRNFDHTLDGLYLPAEIREVRSYRPATDRVTVHVRMLHKSSKQMLCDLDVYNSDNQLCISLRGFESRRMNGGVASESTEDLIYSYSWISQELSLVAQTEPSAADRWIVFMDLGSLGHDLVASLRQQGSHVFEIYRDDATVAHAIGRHFVQVDPSSLDSFKVGLAAAFQSLGDSLNGVIYLWGLDAPDAEDLSTTTLDESTRLTALAPMHLVQAWEQSAVPASTQLTIVTAGAQSQTVPVELTQIAQAPLIGFGRVIASEIASLRCKLVDMPRDVSKRELSKREEATRDTDCLMRELYCGDEEDEVLWRAGSRWVNRFAPHAGKSATREATQLLPSQLRVGLTSGIDELNYQLKSTLELAAGQVEIEVVAAGLNFSDVMKALDLYPGLPDGPIELGAECSGRVSRVGGDCRWNVGDEVIAVAPGAFATHVTVDGALVARKPKNLSHEQAAALPIAFLTAQYALHECARLRHGETVLIHSASGGVGLAAIQLAKLAGARILATAGTQTKRAMVREQGACCVMDSRSLEFGAQTLAATHGAGVDVVLNSLPGEAIKTGLSVLKTGGRFLEIGKRDIYGDTPLGLYPFRNNLAMFAIDLDQLFKQQPQRMGEMLRELVDRFEANELTPLPIKVYAADETQSAYRLMQQGKHIGKVVIGYQRRPDAICAGNLSPVRLDDAATYWIVGGLGGFGLEIARWMSARGAKSLVLSGRNVQLSPAARSLIDELEHAGTRVSLLPADITQADDVRRVVSTIENRLPPLRGIVHSAMVLEDRLLADLDFDTLQRVLRPKVLGGWNLHRETKHLQLDLFVLFSSLSSVFGHAGQANYAAANALLDSLAYYRRAQGLPATVMNWGHLGEVGYLARREQLGQRLERQGVLRFSVKQATDCLEYALQNKALQLSVLRIDWSLWRGLGITNRVSPRFAHLLSGVGTLSLAHGEELPSAHSLRTATGQQRFELVEQLLRTKTSSLLGIAADQILADRALVELGLDSLMAVELRNWIESQLEVNVPISALLRSESLNLVIGLLCDKLSEAADADEASVAVAIPSSAAELVSQERAASLLEQLPNLGADEVAQLLGQMLREQ